MHEDLAALAKGTILLGRPGRTTLPKYGVIAEQRVNNLDSDERKLHLAGAYQGAPSSCNPLMHHTRHSEEEEAVHATTLPSANFEIRTSASALPVELAEFCASVTPQVVQSFDEDVSDENKPLVYPFKEGKDMGTFDEAMIIPEPRHRAKREPLAVLHLDEDSSDTKPRVTIVKREDGRTEKSTWYEAGSPCIPEGESTRPKGLIRLRAKAPPPIDMSLVNKAIQLERELVIAPTIQANAINLDSTKVDEDRMDDGSTSERGVTYAPMMLSVPLPPVTPVVLRSRVVTVPVPAEVALAIPAVRVPKMPITPNRQALLDILNDHSTFHGTVGEKKRF